MQKHTVSEIKLGYDCQVVEQSEVTLNGNAVHHTIAPVLAETGVQDFILLCTNLIFNLSGIGN